MSEITLTFNENPFNLDNKFVVVGMSNFNTVTRRAAAILIDRYKSHRNNEILVMRDADHKLRPDNTVSLVVYKEKPSDGQLPEFVIIFPEVGTTIADMVPWIAGSAVTVTPCGEDELVKIEPANKYLKPFKAVSKSGVINYIIVSCTPMTLSEIVSETFFSICDVKKEQTNG